MRFAGTCSRYSNNAIPQLTSAAMNQGFELSSLRCAYHANVMKTLDKTSKPIVWAITGTSISWLLAALSKHFVDGDADAGGEIQRSHQRRRDRHRHETVAIFLMDLGGQAAGLASKDQDDIV